MNKPKILIVDDEPFNVDYIEQELEDLNYETISAVNGQDAIEKMQSQAPDLVLLDIMMPIMSGFEVLTCMKSNPLTHDIPVIVISANNDLLSVVKGIQLGAEDYLPKPFEPVLLHARIASSLEKKFLRDIQQLYLKNLEREFDIAREIQQSFLPSELPNVNGWKIAAYFKAAHEVAGDYYDVFPLSNGNVVFIIGDVCGKGVGAALFMTLFRSLIRSAFLTDHFIGGSLNSLSTSENLRQVVTFTNNYVSETHNEATIFSTVFIGVLHPQDGTLTYINCGNEPALVIDQGIVVNSLAPTGPVIGVIPDAGFTVKEITVQKSQVLLVFTDGVPDAINAEKIPFGTNRLCEVFCGSGTEPGSILQNIEMHLHNFIGTADQFDDITVLAVQRCS